MNIFEYLEQFGSPYTGCSAKLPASLCIDSETDPVASLRKAIQWLLLSICLLSGLTAFAQQRQPINSNTTPEARQLLKYLYRIQGKKTLSGMHNVLGRMSTNTDRVRQLTGKYPAVWGGDFGFADSTHDIDNIKYRPLLVNEIKKQHQRGAIIVMSYHQANPVIGEPCQFEGGIISELTDAQWQELLTPGTDLHTKWLAQMDLLAGHLKQLQAARIPVIFRPYHEMNGSWFWWGGRPGPQGFVALWNQLYTYYTEHHQLNNLLWAWTPDKPNPGVEAYFPGLDKVDLLGYDIYPRKDSAAAEVYPQRWYATLDSLAAGKPWGLSEHSVLPAPALLEKQPYVWFMSWGEMLFNANTEAEIKRTYQDSRVLTVEEVPKRLSK